MDDDLKIGDRVRLTPLGQLRNTRLRTHSGVIKGRTRGNGYYVLMDGNKTVSTLHASYVEADSGAGAAARCPSPGEEATGC
jgi:hypothetical protein